MEEQANIICLAEDYVVKHTGTKAYVYNMYYEGKLWKYMGLRNTDILLQEKNYGSWVFKNFLTSSNHSARLCFTDGGAISRSYPHTYFLRFRIL